MKTRFRRRRWVWVALLVLLGVAVYYLFRPGPVERLRPYLDQDLRALSEDEQFKFDDLVGRLTPEARVYGPPTRPQSWNPKDWLGYLNAKPIRTGFARRESWYLWRVSNGQGRDRLVLFQGEPLWHIPGGSFAHVFVFDTKGRPLTVCDIQTGWRITIKDARWLEGKGHGFPCLLVCSSRDFTGADIASQYYAFLADDFALVRLEDSAGAFVPVNYEITNFTIGPPVPERTPEQWEAALRSSNRAEVLRTLVWLGGLHTDLPLREGGTCAERFEDATWALETRARPGVRSAVEALTRSEDRWVQEAAQHAWQAIQGRER
jgi:hypothetical protein